MTQPLSSSPNPRPSPAHSRHPTESFPLRASLSPHRPLQGVAQLGLGEPWTETEFGAGRLEKEKFFGSVFGFEILPQPSERLCIQNLAGALYSEGAGCTLSLGPEVKMEIPDKRI